MQMNTAIQANAGTLLTEAQAADFLNVSVRTLQSWRVKGGGPLYGKIGRSVRYRQSDLNTYVEENLTTSTSEAGAK